MATSHLQASSETRLQDAEVLELRKRLVITEDSADGVVRVRDLAEASGVSVSEVIRHLDRIRAEASVRPRAVRHTVSWLIPVGLGVLVAGGYVTYRRIVQDRPPELINPVAPGYIPPPAAFPTTTRVQPSVPNAPTYADGALKAKPPTGIQIELIGQSSDVMSNGDGAPIVKPMDHDAEIRQIEDSVLAQLSQSQFQDARNKVDSSKGFRDYAGNVIHPRPNQIHYTISGWPGVVTGWISFPAMDADKARLHADVESLFKDAWTEQQEALRTDIDPGKGIVSPPPGFAVETDGVRRDRQTAPRAAFLPMPASQVEARLGLAIQNAIYRDARPPIGPWAAGQEPAKPVPPPPLSHVRIETPGGEPVEFDLPTGHGWTARAKSIVEKFVAKATKTIDLVK